MAALSGEQMAAILDSMPAAVMVSAAEDNRLLYANASAREIISGGGVICPYGGQTECVIGGRVYRLSGKEIDWAGEKAQLVSAEDITDRVRERERFKSLEKETVETFDRLACGLCIYKAEGGKITPFFHNRVFYEIMGYSEESKRLVERETDYLNVHPEDVGLLREKIGLLLRDGGMLEETYRLWNDRLGEYRWIHLEGTVHRDTDGGLTLYGVYSDISERKRLEKELTDANRKMQATQMEMNHLINSIPGGIASYRVENGRFIQDFFSDGVMALSGRTREEYEAVVSRDSLDLIYEQDRARVSAAALAAMESGEVLDISCRTRHQNGNLIWVHLHGKRMGERSENARFYVVFTNMLAEVGTLANETADGVYIIDKDSYDLLYINEAKKLNVRGSACVGQTCYASLHGFKAPCEFCTLKTYGPDEQEHEIRVKETGLVYTTRVKETVWNGIPVYVLYLRDVTEEAKARQEKERLEMYFQTLVKNLPGGIAVVRCTPDGGMTPEYISEGFAAMTKMTVEEAENLYRGAIFAGIHPEDAEYCQKELLAFIESGEEHRELTARFLRGDGTYLWVRDNISLLEGPDGLRRLYCIYTDVSKSVEEKEQLRRQYEDLILRHYRTPGPDTLVLGHCNITQNRIIEIWDSTDSGLLDYFGRNRQEFFTGLSGLVAEPGERRLFLDTYLNEPSMEAFRQNKTELVLQCFIKLPKESHGRYVRFQVNLVETPDTGDVTGILSVTDVTDKAISEQILRRLSVTSHDYVIDLDLSGDQYTVLTRSENASRVPLPRGSYSKRVAYMAESVVVPKDRAVYTNALAADKMEKRLRECGFYTFAYSVEDENGGIRAKNMTVSAIDLRLGRVSLVCTDITSSVREQQNLLSMLAYTFELAGMIDVQNGSLIMYTREMILGNLPPFVSGKYEMSQKEFTHFYVEESREEARRQFRLETMLQRLAETPSGYEFVLPYQGKDGEAHRYKQINVLWGDHSHETICLVRADVTEMLAAERQTKNKLEKALASAEEANRAKSDFLSAMSHDIRTPMNAIMGMITLAPAHIGDRAWMVECLRKISISSKHLLSLINDVLDMSRIERGQVSLNPVQLSLPELTGHLSVMMADQAKEAGVAFTVRMENTEHTDFYGDSLRIDQILINLLSNAVKFTPKGGSVSFLTEEIPPVRDTGAVRYRFTVSDTGIGMSGKFLETVFEPFVRADSAARIEGTGLGLSIVQGLVELMNGEISVESRTGEGSVFRVELEFEAAQHEAVAEAHPCSPQEEDNRLFLNRRFLVAEDNALNAEILCEILCGYGARPVVRTDGAQAVAAFQESEAGAYDAVLMDIQMPNMNGYEASRAIRAMERPDAKTIPIVALTANAFAEDIRTATAAGMTAHVAKPIDVAVLRATLCRVLS